MSDQEKNIIISPNVGVANTAPEIDFISADASSNAKTISLKVYPTSKGTLSFEGNTGQLFSITDSMSGTIFSVNDISGIPSIEVLDTGLVKLAEYGGNVKVWGGLSLSKNSVEYGFKPYYTTIGNGSATSISINHRLSSNNIIVTVKETATGNVVYPDIVQTNTNYMLLTFVTAPTANQYTVSIIGM